MPIEDWNQLKNNLPTDAELPQWQRDVLDERMKLIQQNPAGVVPLEDFIAEMEKEANEEV